MSISHDQFDAEYIANSAGLHELIPNYLLKCIFLNCNGRYIGYWHDRGELDAKGLGNHPRPVLAMAHDPIVKELSKILQIVRGTKDRWMRSKAPLQKLLNRKTHPEVALQLAKLWTQDRLKDIKDIKGITGTFIKAVSLCVAVDGFHRYANIYNKLALQAMDAFVQTCATKWSNATAQERVAVEFYRRVLIFVADRERFQRDGLSFSKDTTFDLALFASVATMSLDKATLTALQTAFPVTSTSQATDDASAKIASPSPSHVDPSVQSRSTSDPANEQKSVGNGLMTRVTPSMDVHGLFSVDHRVLELQQQNASKDALIAQQAETIRRLQAENQRLIPLTQTSTTTTAAEREAAVLDALNNAPSPPTELPESSSAMTKTASLSPSS